MNLLFSCIGKRGYIARYFRPSLPSGSRIIGTSNSVVTPGFRACDEGVIMPDIVDESYPAAILELCERTEIAALLSFFDLDVMTLAPHADKFRSRGVLPFVPNERQARIAFDKLATDRFLQEKGFARPRTYADLAAAEAALDAGALAFPVYVKPRYGFGSRNTFLARNSAAMRAFAALEPDMIVQETLNGDMYNVEVCNDVGGRALSVVPWRKHCSRHGETEYAVTCEFPELVDLAVALSEAVGHPGPMDADLFVNRDRLAVLELNLRFGGGYPVSHLAGANFPELIVAMAEGRKPQPRIGEYERDVAMMKELIPFGGSRSELRSECLHIGPDSRQGGRDETD